MKSLLKLIVTTGCVTLALSSIAQTPVLINTFTNPAPAAGDGFGTAIAALGSDRVLIGAPYHETGQILAGIVYLFHTNGTLLTTITNPNPSSVSNMDVFSPQFGCAIATLGSDRVLIGAPLDRKICMYTTNGELVATINGLPNLDNYSFGAALATFGNGLVLIGEPRTWVDAENDFEMGMAYLYGTNGTLLSTFSNPDVGAVMHFGDSLEAFGNDRVLIRSGPGYLFNTNGTLLTTFTNPAPEKFDYFGVAGVVGNDRVLISAYGHDGTTTNAGALCVVNTNGALLTIITNPTPASGDYFGSGVAVLGNDRVVIGAPGDDTTGTNAGSAYVFNLNGTLLATINNPAPAPGDGFGSAMLAFGNESVLILSWLDDTGTVNAGSASLFSVPSQPIAPSLTIQLTSSNTVAVSWPSPSTGFVLQQNTNGVSSVDWSNVIAGIQNDGTNKSLIINPTGQSRFYRLVLP